MPGALFPCLESVALGNHGFVENPEHEDSILFLPVEDDVAALFHAPKFSGIPLT